MIEESIKQRCGGYDDLRGRNDMPLGEKVKKEKAKYGIGSEFKTATTENLYNMWSRGGVIIKFYESLESETPYIVERWSDWFNLPKEFENAIFETYADRMDGIVVIKAYMKKRR
jgi:hypothetical protein